MNKFGNKIATLLVVMSLLGWEASTGFAQNRDKKPVTGRYDSVSIVVKSDGSIMGDFYDETGAGQFSCGFLLYSDGKYKVVTWWPFQELGIKLGDNVVWGTLRFANDALFLQLPQHAHGGCWNVNPDLDQGQEVELDLMHPHPEWREIRVVKAKRAYLHKAPDLNDHTRAYVTEGDTVFVTEQRGKWLHVQYYTVELRESTGWVQESDLLPFRVPEASPAQK